MACWLCCSTSRPGTILGNPMNYICDVCYEDALRMFAMMNNHKEATNNSSKFQPREGISKVVKWVEEMKETKEELQETRDFLSGFVVAFKDQIHTDIYVKPGNNGPPIPAHRALLASRSSILRDMLDMDGNVAPPNETITLAEMNHEELECLLEILYQGHLPKEKVDKHIYALSMAADKYEITFLQKYCEKQMLRSLSTDNVLDFLDVSDTYSTQSFKEAVLNFIVENMQEVLFSASFDRFALRNPRLTVQITRACFVGSKNGNSGEDKKGVSSGLSPSHLLPSQVYASIRGSSDIF